MIGSGLRNLAASSIASNWVLSPISPRATTPVEMKKASSNWDSKGRQKPETTRRPRPFRRRVVKGLAKLGAVRTMAVKAKCVDANPYGAGRLLPNDEAESIAQGKFPLLRLVGSALCATVRESRIMRTILSDIRRAGHFLHWFTSGLSSR